MATAKRPTSAQKKPVRERVVPVRVVKSAPRPRVVPNEKPLQSRPVASKRRQTVARLPRPEDGDRRVAMWSGVSVAAAIIFVLWIAIVRLDISQPASSDTLFGRIKTELQGLFGSKKNSNNNSADKELNQLRNQVFPNINDETFVTNNQNLNSNNNVNSGSGNLNLNTSLNSNTNF